MALAASSWAAEPVKIASGLEPLQQAVAWAPDGQRIAFIKGEKAIVADTQGKTINTIKLKGAKWAALLWSDGGLFILTRDSAEASALRAYGNDLAPSYEMPIQGRAIALHALGQKTILVETRALKKLSFGVEYLHTLIAMDTDTRATAEVFFHKRIHTGREVFKEEFRGMLSVGPRPLSAEMMLVELITPPAVPAYTRMESVDIITNKRAETQKTRDYLSLARGSWRPDGLALAIESNEGRLLIIDHKGTDITPNDLEIKGHSPQWSPAGDVIFFGGMLIDETGAVTATLFPEGQDAVGWWSPQGGSLAAINDERLYIISNVSKGLSSAELAGRKALGEKLTNLRRLLQEGLIDKQIYEERRAALIKGETK